MVIYARPGAAALQQADPMRLRYAKLTPPARGPFAVPNRRAGIPAKVTTSAGSRPLAAGIQAPKLVAPGPVSFFRPPSSPVAAPVAVSPAAKPIPRPVDATARAAAREIGPAMQPQALLGW
jgi:hypothetical protein